MINKFYGYDEIQVSDGAALEAGGYVCRIMGVQVISYPSCTIMKAMIDIAEGERSHYFTEKFKRARQANPSAKWAGNGIFDVFIPKDDGSEKDANTKRWFKRFITSVEDSSEGYTWNWDEQSLKGKTVGLVFGREQFMTNDGKLMFATKPRFAVGAERIRTGDFKIPDDKLLGGQTGTNMSSGNTAAATGDFSGYEVISDGPLPF